MLTILASTSVCAAPSCSRCRTRTNSPRLPANDEFSTIERFVGSPVFPTSLPRMWVAIDSVSLRREVPVREPDVLKLAPLELTGDASAVVFEEGSKGVQFSLGQLDR